MGRLIRKTAILAKIENTSGTDSVPTGAANAVLVSNASFELSYNNVGRDLVRPFLGGSEQLVGLRFVDIKFDVELANSGTAGTAPAWGPLLRACGFAEASLTTPARIEYSPISATFTSLTVYYHLDGVLRKATGCMGTAEMSMMEGERPVWKFSFSGIDAGRAAAADPTVTLTAWKTPSVVSDLNSGDINLGCTYAAGALTGGTTYPSRGLMLTLGNTVSKKALLGGQAVQISQREVTGSVQMDLTAAQEVSFLADINSNTVTGLGFTHGTGAGVGLVVHAPAVQRINPKDTDYEGDVHSAMDLRLVPSTGNDELRVICL